MKNTTPGRFEKTNPIKPNSPARYAIRDTRYEIQILSASTSFHQDKKILGESLEKEGGCFFKCVQSRCGLFFDLGLVDFELAERCCEVEEIARLAVADGMRLADLWDFGAKPMEHCSYS